MNTIKKIISCFILLCSICVFACQPTPDHDAVMQKNYYQMLEHAKKQEGESTFLLRERVEAPFTYSDEIVYKNDTFALKIDVSVEIPNSYKMPIVEIVPIDFTQEQTQMFFDRFCSNKEMFISYPNTPMTREEIESTILFLNQEIDDMKENGQDDDPYMDQCRADLLYYQSIYLDAPGTIDPVRCYGKLMTQTVYSPKTHTPVYSYSWVTAKAEEMSNRNYPCITSFSVVNRSDLEQAKQIDGEWYLRKSEAIMSFLDQRNLTLGEQNPHYRIVDYDEAVNVPFTPQEAKDATMSFLRSLNLEQEIGIDSIWLYQSSSNDSDYSYEVRLSRIIEGIPCAFDKTLVVSEYMDTWQYEQITLNIDASGIFCFKWFSPIKVTKIVQEDTSLLPFERIMEVFTTHVKHALIPSIQEYLESGGMVSQRYNINRITLSLQRISQPNNFDSALLVPVWSFYGTQSTEWRNSNSAVNISNKEISSSLITINAIDGTIINLQEGY